LGFGPATSWSGDLATHAPARYSQHVITNRPLVSGKPVRNRRCRATV